METEDVELEDIEEELNNTDVDQAVIDDLLAGVEEPSEISSPGDAAHEQTEAEDGVMSLREQSGVPGSPSATGFEGDKVGHTRKPREWQRSSKRASPEVVDGKEDGQSVRRSMSKIGIHSKLLLPLHWQRKPQEKEKKKRKRCWPKSITVSQR